MERPCSFEDLGREQRELIARFEEVVRAFRGQYWAPESALPCRKFALLELLTSTKGSTATGNGTYERLASLVADLSHFIPDDDLAAARGYLTARGGVIAGSLDADRERVRDRLVELFRQHRSERDRILRESLLAASGPIGEARWSVWTRRKH